jgi:hypothetical protein
MSDPIATVGSVAVAAAGEVPRPPLLGEVARRRETAPASNSSREPLPETRAVARETMQVEGRFQVRIHAETMRVITEVVDMVTGDVLLYLPPGYRPNANPLAKTEQEPAGVES